MKIKSSSITPIIKATAEVLSIPEHVVQDVVEHQFQTLSDYFDNPTHPSIRLDHLGSFYISKNALYHAFTTIRRNYSYTKLPKEVVKLRFLFKIRHLAYTYSYLKNYKKRFGSWH